MLIAEWCTASLVLPQCRNCAAAKQHPLLDEGKYPHGCWPGLDVAAGNCGGVVAVGRGVGRVDGDEDGDGSGLCELRVGVGVGDSVGIGLGFETATIVGWPCGWVGGGFTESGGAVAGLRGLTVSEAVGLGETDGETGGETDGEPEVDGCGDAC